MLKHGRPDAVRMEFHVSRRARDRYQFDASLFSLSGNVLFANFHAARVFAQRMNQQRDLVNFPEQAVKPGQINALGLIDEILHYVVGLYRAQRNPHVMRQALAWLDDRLGRRAVDTALRRFADHFPPLAVYRCDVALESYLAGETAGVPHRQLVLEELLLLMLAVIQISADRRHSAVEVAEAIAGWYDVVTTWQRAAERSGYQVEQLLELVEQ